MDEVRGSDPAAGQKRTMDPDSFRQQIDRLERKVDTLRWMQMAQAISLIVLAATYLLKLAPTLLILAVLLLPALVYFRSYLPGAARWSGRVVSTILRSWSRDTHA